MARQRVAPENRIRAAQACENCKRRKQKVSARICRNVRGEGRPSLMEEGYSFKCNGTVPCSHCTKRRVECHFLHPVPPTTEATITRTRSPERRKNRKRAREPEDQSAATSRPFLDDRSESTAGTQSLATPFDATTSSRQQSMAALPLLQNPSSRESLHAMEGTAENSAAAHNVESETDEAEIQGMTRMLSDGRGRMCMSCYAVEPLRRDADFTACSICWRRRAAIVFADNTSAGRQRRWKIGFDR